MGYRSEVAIKVRKIDYELADNKVKDVLAEVFGVPEDSGSMMVFHHDWIKWYEEYDEIKTIMDWVNNLNDEDYGMIILGEDDSDIEYKGDPWNNGLSVTRSISY